SCESNDKYYGTYLVKDDTLYIHNIGTDTDSLLSSSESERKSQEAKYKIICVNGKLKYIERWSYSISMEKWIKDDFQFDDNFLFEKVQ
ncbi:MAG: hypothetical protein U1C59_00815, partial [Methylotenera sp.]|nr:hypothetical protein [Methylotenera sp.]